MRRLSDLDLVLNERLLVIFADQFAKSARLATVEDQYISESVEIYSSGDELRVVDRHTGSSWDAPWDGSTLRAEMFVELSALFAGQQIREETLLDKADE